MLKPTTPNRIPVLDPSIIPDDAFEVGVFVGFPAIVPIIPGAPREPDYSN